MRGSASPSHQRSAGLLQGLDALSKLEDGDRIVKAKVVSGLDKLT